MKTLNPVLNALALALGLSIAGASHGAAIFDPAKQPYGQLPPLALTGFNLSSGTQKAFQVWFDGNTWSGDVVAYPVGTDGKTDVSARLWSASVVFQSKQACGNGTTTDQPSATTNWYDAVRKIVTRSSTGANKPFRWASISAAQQTSIGDATTGPKILNYVRGDRVNEKLNTVMDGTGTIVEYQCGISSGTLRARNSILGDFIHSKSVYVAAPPADYQFDSYQTFKTNNASRAPRLYAGGNDGMLHAFNADTGEEVWAYIPSLLISKLKNLATDPYTHNYFIDGGLTAGDVNFGTTAAPDWRTVLIGGLGAGGKGLYALDATSPDATNETFAAAKILWEITPATSGFNDLGDTYGDPIIVRLNTGQWAAIVGNGYNNTASGRAWLYIIDIKTGALIKALDTGSGSTTSPNGLSSPVAIDTNFDGKVDRVYAGDIDGNLWKFDISDSNAGNWTAPTTPLIATGKSIVGAPDVAAHPISGYIVYFATGRLFTAADGSDSTVANHAYGIWDGAPAANTALLDQTLTEKAYGSIRVRVSSGLPVNWSDASDPTNKPLHRGWRTALPPGERVMGAGFVRDARYHFSAVNPVIVNTTPPNGENWLNELDYLTGGVGDKLIFDLNSDSLLTDADRVQDAGGAPIAGPTGIAVAVFQGAGLLSQPVLAILSAQLSTTIFNDNPYFSPAEQPSDPPPPSTDPGVAGGHFDVDIYNAAGKISHTHEYDDKFDVTGVNFLAASDPVKNISTVITSTTTKFKILIAHQKMSPAVKFSYGGLPYQKIVDMTEYTTAGLSMASLPAFDRTTIKTLKYNMPKNAFEVNDWASTGDLRVGLMPTQTGCVNGGTTGTVGPAPSLLNRNGALLFQLVKDTTPDSAIQLADAAGDPKYGYRVKNTERATYLLAEWSTFWHHPNGNCLGSPGWVKDPPQDTSVSTAAPNTPAAGSQDPPRDELGSVVSTTTTTVADPNVPGGKIRTTITTYSTGAQVIVEEYLDNKGKVTKTIVTTVPPPGGVPGGGGAGGGVSQSLSAPNTVTGYQQTRNSGKLGRVSWHELFSQ